MSVISAIPPGLVLIAGAGVLPLLRGGVRQGAVLVVPLLALWWVWQIPDGAALTLSFLDYRLTPVEGDRLSRLFATGFAIVAFAGGLFALRQSRVVELSAAFLLAGSAIGVAFAGDLVTLVVFWEVIAIGSTVVVWSSGTEKSYRAAMRYLLVHLLGGVVLMTGVIAHIAASGSVDFVAMKPDSVGTWMILAGVLINAGAPPLSAWLPDAYPEASPGGMVLLSAFTTKTAVYVLLRGFAGSEILLFVGLYMIFYGIIYALLENDMRRILAYSIVNQVGFMICGIGIGTPLALNGAAAHAVTHILYKALLLMAAGSVLHMTGKRKCSELGGLFQSMKLTTLCGSVGALSISAFPLTSGFVAKSMIGDAAAAQDLGMVWYLLAAGSAGVFLHAGIKFPWFVFFHKDAGLRPPDPPLNMRLAMVLLAALCVGIGLFPSLLYAVLPFPVDFVPYTAEHVVGMLQLLLFSGLAFFICLPLMKRTPTISLDLDWFYRRLLWNIGRRAADRIADGHGRAMVGLTHLARRFIVVVARHHGPEGMLARSWPTGPTALWVAVMLAAWLVISYV